MISHDPDMLDAARRSRLLVRRTIRASMLYLYEDLSPGVPEAIQVTHSGLIYRGKVQF